MNQQFFLTLATTTILVGMVSLPAQAEWEYTRWGMSVDEVVEASEGEAIPVNPDEEILLEDDTQVGRLGRFSNSDNQIETFCNEVDQAVF